jgi:hypothetical protein
VIGASRVSGALASSPRAAAFADEVAALLADYAREVVAAHRLCPHLHDVGPALGAVCVVLDRELDVAAAAELARMGSAVVHLVYPLTAVAAPVFERFGNALAERLARDGGPRVVHAAFHPALAAGGDAASRLVAIARRAPDPFVQLVPADIHGGSERPREPPPLDDIAARVAELHARRRRRYTPYADELGIAL